MSMSSPRFSAPFAPARLSLALALALPALAWSQSMPPVQQMREVVVTASGFEQDLKQAPASISVINRQQLQERRVTSIADALSDVEGVDVRGGTGKTGGLNISIRGLPSDYTLILIDGRRQNVAGDVTPNGFGETSTSFLPPVSAIERIEVIRGPMSTLYGSDAMGGVVNIITRPVANEWGGSVTVERGIPQDSDFSDTTSTNFYLNGPIKHDRLGLALRGSYLKRGESNLHASNVDGVEVSRRGPAPVESDIYSIGGKLTLKANADHDFWLDLDRSRQWYNNDESQLGTLDVPGDYAGYADYLRFHRDQVAIGHVSRFSFGRLESSLMHNTTETLGRTIPNIADNSPLRRHLTPGAARKLETTNLVFDSKLVTPIGDAHVLTSGVQFWDARMRDGLVPDKYRQKTYSIFAEDEWMLRQDLTATLGLRYDRHDAFGGHFSPRGYLVWNATDNWTVKGGVSRGYKTPRLNQLHDGMNGVSGQGRTLNIGNPDLKPETSTSTELGLLYDNLAGFTAGATVFHNRFRDKIASGNAVPNCDFAAEPNLPGCVSIGALPTQREFGQQTNLDSATTQGVELSTRIPLAERWSLSMNYTYTDSEVKNDGQANGELSDTPKHMANAMLRWSVNERFSTWLQAEYRGKARRFEGDPSNLTGNDRLAYEAVGDLRSWAMLHLGASYRLTDNVTLTGNVYNLLDKDFLKYRSYVNQDGETVYINEYSHSAQSTRGTIQAGRTFWLSATVTF
ncbi:TonB-dependent receptor [Orrella sp. JC864]|uniref:TonB-dependent receptor domain-containing protein n=1 Tax=Orrella sp. JC864 TaxID=3120298 RepID=UPI00300952DC